MGAWLWGRARWTAVAVVAFMIAFGMIACAHLAGSRWNAVVLFKRGPAVSVSQERAVVNRIAADRDVKSLVFHDSAPESGSLAMRPSSPSAGPRNRVVVRTADRGSAEELAVQLRRLSVVRSVGIARS